MKRYQIVEYRDEPADLVEVSEEGFEVAGIAGDTEFCLSSDVADLERRYREAVELLKNVYTSGVSLDDERIRYMEVQIYRADWQEIGAFLAEEEKTDE